MRLVCLFLQGAPQQDENQDARHQIATALDVEQRDHWYAFT